MELSATINAQEITVRALSSLWINIVKLELLRQK